MRVIEHRVDVTDWTSSGGSLETATTVHLLEGVADRPTVLHGFPADGFGRTYDDVQRLSRYSRAEHHTGQSPGFVACDQLSVVHRSQPDARSPAS